MSNGQRIPPSCIWWLALLLIPAIIVWIRRAVRPPKSEVEAIMQGIKDDELKDKVRKGMWLLLLAVFVVSLIVVWLLKAAGQPV